MSRIIGQPIAGIQVRPWAVFAHALQGTTIVFGFRILPERRVVCARATGRPGNACAGLVEQLSSVLHPSVSMSCNYRSSADTSPQAARLRVQPAREAELQNDNKADPEEAKRNACHDFNLFHAGRFARPDRQAHLALRCGLVYSSRPAARRFRHRLNPRDAGVGDDLDGALGLRRLRERGRDPDRGKPGDGRAPRDCSGHRIRPVSSAPSPRGNCLRA